jgi:chromosome segregation ATPase
MTLRLLRPSEALDAVQKRSDKEARRAIEVQDLITRKYKELADMEKAFEDSLERQRLAWEQEYDTHNKTAASLEGVVRVLEERHQKALVPLVTKREVLDTKERELAVFESTLTSKEAKVAELKEKLESRLDEIGERSLQLDTIATSLLAKEQGIQAQAAQVTRYSEEVSRATQLAHGELTSAQGELEKQRILLKTKEDNLTLRERNVTKQQKEFTARERAINDKYATLQRAIEESKKKYNLQ